MMQKDKFMDSVLVGIFIISFVLLCITLSQDVVDTYSNNDVVNDEIESNIEITSTVTPTCTPTISPTPFPTIIEEVLVTHIVYEFDIQGYTTANLNVRIEPNTDCEILEIIPKYSEIKFSYLEDNDEWVIISYEDDKYAYLNKSYIKEGLPYEIKIATDDTRKSYMDWRKITDKSSKQWELQHQYASTNDNGIRVVDGRCCIALGSYYTHNIGQYIDVVLDNGLIIPCILSDAKQDRHTKNNHSIGLDGGVVEFIVDTDFISEKVKTSGDVSYISKEWRSHVVELKIYYKNLFD